jgi:hypothetical protein
MFSLKSGQPIAQIKGGRYDGEILHFIPRSNIDFEIPENAECFSVIGSAYIQPLPIREKEMPFHAYISGKGGSGKSYYACGLIREYFKMYPKNNVNLFSYKENDENYDAVKKNHKRHFRKYYLDEELVKDPIDVEKELKNSLIVFDDIDQIGDKKIKACVQNLRRAALEIGRSAGIDVICTTHTLNNGTETRNLINEASDITIYPQKTAAHFMKYFLERYIGLNANQREMLYNLNSRWITLHNRDWLLYEKGAIVL